MGKIKSIILKDSERLALETGFRQGDSHCFRMLLPIDGMPDRENAHGFICR